ncbi:PIN domain-containing protein [Legionella tunisiensis]|uniref:PIN domain-containing protein n=1 Tax=Legionella tunisiensis TaxID=1034944 RepID=UPI0003128916|nr:PIN domain-containing protein [Legionella tunisiensis]
MVNFAVLYDACVLYPAPLRDLLMRLAMSELFRAKWSNRIHEEWINNLLRNREDLKRQDLERTRDLMNMHVLDSLVENFEDIEKALNLPDPNDNHVLAAAIVSNCNVLVTFNLKDFLEEELNKYNIEAQHPDDFLMHLTDLNENRFLDTVKKTRVSLRNPPKTADEYLSTLQQGLKKSFHF